MADVPAAKARVSDQELVDAVRAGDIAAFSVLVDRHHGLMLSHLQRQTGNPELAADLAQETFLDAFRHLDRLGRDDSLTAWLFGIARNNVRMEYRRRLLWRVVSLEWLAEPVTSRIPALRREDETASCDERDAIQSTLDALTPSLREALLLHSLGGCPASEVAQVLGISLEAAERRISRAKLEFRDRYRAMNGKDAS